MRSIINYLKQYVADYFNIRLYVSIAIFLAISIALNYHYDFEDSVVDSYYGQPIQLLYFFLFQAMPYYVVCLLIYWFTDAKEFVYKSGFWTSSFIGLLILATDRWFYFHKALLSYSPSQLDTIIYKCTSNLNSFLIIVLPLYIFYKLVDVKAPSFYGITKNGINPKPYFVLLLLVLPLVIGASFFPDFLRQYPMYQRANGLAASLYLELPEWVMVLTYEATYALSFFSVELIFRGFLALGLMRYLGPYVILPMVACYAFLHFGKPVGETIGSVFGGYILGVVAYYSRNIWGGIIVHVGLALLMELIAYLQK